MLTLTSDKYLSDKELSSLQRTLKLARQRNERDVLLIELALNSGIREGELLTLKPSDLNQENHSVFVKEPEKGSSPREIPLPLDLFNRLYTYAQNIEGKLFPISDSRVRQIWYEYRSVKKKFHSLRHTFARSVYKRTKDIRLVQYLLGHKSLTSTMIYTTIDYEANETRRAMGL